MVFVICGFFFQAEDGIRDADVTGVQTCALPISAYDVQRACGTSLTTTVQLAQRIARGEIEAAIAGGVDTTSDAPIVYSKPLARIVRDSARGKTPVARLRPWLRLHPRDLKP